MNQRGLINDNQSCRFRRLFLPGSSPRRKTPLFRHWRKCRQLSLVRGWRKRCRESRHPRGGGIGNGRSRMPELRPGREPSAFAGGPDVETAVRTIGLLIAGRNPGNRADEGKVKGLHACGLLPAARGGDTPTTPVLGGPVHRSAGADAQARIRQEDRDGDHRGNRADRGEFPPIGEGSEESVLPGRDLRLLKFRSRPGHGHPCRTTPGCLEPPALESKPVRETPGMLERPSMLGATVLVDDHH